MDKKTASLLLKTAKGRKLYFEELERQQRLAERIAQTKKGWTWRSLFFK